MDQDATVAVVRSDNRRAAAAEALALIVDDLRACATSSVVIVPQPRTHADTLSAALDAFFHAGAIEAVVVEPHRQADRLGHRREALGRPVRFVDPDEAGTGDLLAAIAASSCVVELWHVARGASWDTPPPARVLIVDAFDVQRTVIAGTDAEAVRAVALRSDRSSIRVVGDAATPLLARPHWRFRPKATAGRGHAV